MVIKCISWAQFVYLSDTYANGRPRVRGALFVQRCHRILAIVRPNVRLVRHGPGPASPAVLRRAVRSGVHHRHVPFATDSGPSTAFPLISASALALHRDHHHPRSAGRSRRTDTMAVFLFAGEGAHSANTDLALLRQVWPRGSDLRHQLRSHHHATTHGRPPSPAGAELTVT